MAHDGIKRAVCDALLRIIRALQDEDVRGGGGEGQNLNRKSSEPILDQNCAKDLGASYLLGQGNKGPINPFCSNLA